MMNPRHRHKRKYHVDPRFEMKIDGFVNSRLEITPPKTERDPATPRTHVVLDPTKSKLNQKFDETNYPEEIIAMHIFGYHRAYRRYVEKVTDIYEKQWEDEERVRRVKSTRLSYPTDPLNKRRKDQHVLERIIQDSKRTTGRSTDNRASSARRPRVIRTSHLPPENHGNDRATPRIFYFG
ncbi:hypothetical protein TRFO_38673 [Tritrichomonas foetus]|uniref:Uncharacterized protein n=1 Tax=Tritrichomonas foetus TaxID=1144522 RepID=A0A1J4JCG0_9EUKA|nr:hypothetical protein TRFO_38673 [Tritrichomonas foetus]|eukprot:OHS95101.1 hypothetical protein TRFO_38673 [Tritrichomonas foetus]